jgi:riboflavin kinase/FMN adenylyltransferase
VELVAGSAAGSVVSSTYIRSCVDAGDVAAAAGALGRPHRLAGVVVRGDQRGRELGFPTANLLTAPHAAVPADGVYAAWLIRLGTGRSGTGRSGIGRSGIGTGRSGIDTGRRGPASPVRLPAAVSIGTNPTFAGRQRRVEAFILDFDSDVYGERVALDFAARLREMRRYDDVAALVAQIEKDVIETRAALAAPR